MLLREFGIKVRMKLRRSPSVALVHQSEISLLKGGGGAGIDDGLAWVTCNNALRHCGNWVQWVVELTFGT